MPVPKLKCRGSEALADGDRVEQLAVGHMEKKMNEVHSLVTLIYRCDTHPLEPNIRSTCS